MAVPADRDLHVPRRPDLPRVTRGGASGSGASDVPVRYTLGPGATGACRDSTTITTETPSCLLSPIVGAPSPSLWSTPDLSVSAGGRSVHVTLPFSECVGGERARTPADSPRRRARTGRGTSETGAPHTSGAVRPKRDPPVGLPAGDGAGRWETKRFPG